MNENAALSVRTCRVCGRLVQPWQFVCDDCYEQYLARLELEEPLPGEPMPPVPAWKPCEECKEEYLKLYYSRVLDKWLCYWCFLRHYRLEPWQLAHLSRKHLEGLELGLYWRLRRRRQGQGQGHGKGQGQGQGQGRGGEVRL